VAVDVVNMVQRSRSVCGPLVEIGVYKGWFIAVLAAIAVRTSLYATNLTIITDSHTKSYHNVRHANLPLRTMPRWQLCQTEIFRILGTIPNTYVNSIYLVNCVT
jgi:hypothetical protein